MSRLARGGRDVQQFLIVDGYNMIFGWTELKQIAKENLEFARDKLVEMFADYQGYTSEQIIIVFDAYNVKGNQGQVIAYNKNVDIIYTKEKETADQYIEKTAKAMEKKYMVRVATSDVVEQVIILSTGATRVSSDKMLEEIKTIGKNFDKYKSTSQHIKSNPLENWMSSEMIETMEKLRRGIVD